MTGSARVRIWIAIAAATASACSQPTLFAQRAGQTALFIIDAPATQPVLYAKSLPAEMQTFPIEVEPMSRITVVLYQGTTEELQLPTEPMEEAPSGRLPPTPFEAAHAGTYRRHNVADWEPIDELPQVFLPAFDYLRCAKLGGCLTEQNAALRRERCTLPCPFFEPLEAVTPPTPPSFEYCPPSAEALDCARTLPELTPCADDEMWLFNVGCTRVGTTCPPDGWPLDPPAQAVYVRTGANGTGTKNDPFPSINAAMQAGAETILLARGEYREQVMLSSTSSVAIIGACPRADGSVIAGHNMQINGFLTLKNLRVEDASIVIARGDAHLEDVILRGQDTTHTLQIREHGQARVKHSLVMDGRPWSIRVAGSAQLEQIEVRGTNGIALSAGTLEITDFVVTSTHGLHSSGLLTMRRGRFRHQEVGLRFDGASSASIEDTVVEGGGSGMVIDGGSLSAKRLVIQDSNTGIHAGREELMPIGLNTQEIRVEDLAISNTTNPVSIHRTLTTSIARAAITGFRENGIHVDYSMTSSPVPDCMLVLNDVTLDGAGHRGIWTRQVPFEISRVSIATSGPSSATSEARGIHLSDTSGVLRDVSVNNPSQETGISFSTDVERTLVGERIFVEASGKYGLQLAFECAVHLSQIRLEHADVGLHVGPLAQVELEQFGVGFCSTGIEIGEGELSKGEIYNNGVGIHSSRAIAQSLTEVRFRDNEEDIVQ